MELKGETTHVIVHPNMPIRSHLLQKDIDYYKFKAKVDHINTLIFQFTVLNGDIIVYGSHTEPYPNKTHHDTEAAYNMDRIMFTS